MNSVKNIINTCNRNILNKKYNILTFPTHERYESQLAKTGHDFYSFSMKGGKKWNKEQIPTPENYYLLPEDYLCDYISYDFILVQSKFWQYQVAKQINQFLKLPIIVLEHTLPTPQTISNNDIEKMRNMVGDINIFISEYSQNQWKINAPSTVIHHGIDTDSFKPLNLESNNKILTVANDFINRDYCLNYNGWKRVTQDLPTQLIGDTKGLSVSASSTDELIEEYNKCILYFNSSTLSPIPTSLLEAMSCGCAVVSTATCMIPEIIQNGINGYISNDEIELRNSINKIMNDTELRSEFGKNARQTIIDKFSQQVFVDKWNNIFDTIYEVSKK